MSQSRTLRCLRVALFTVVCAVVGAFAATASAATAQQQQAVDRVQAQVSHLPAPSTRGQAQANVAALKQVVDQAVAAGAGPELAQQTSSPDVRMSLLRYATVKVTGGHSSVAPPTANAARRHRAHSAGCWGTAWTRYTINWWGADIAWRQVQINGWCGNGSSITWYGGAGFSSWDAAPYCWTSISTDFSWDVPFSWIHARNYGTLGGSYVWGCASLQTLHPAVRIAGSGYWDHYNDYPGG